MNSQQGSRTVLRKVFSYIGITNVQFVLAGGSLGVNRGLVKLEDHLARYEQAVAAAARG